MKKMIIAVAVIAIAAAMCIPACVFADSSDAACTKTNGSAGISVEMSTSDEKEIVKFFPKDGWNDMANDVWTSNLNGLIATLGIFTISEGKIVEIQKYAESKGKEVTDDYVSTVDSTSMIMKYSFKATCNSDDYPFFENDLGQLIKYIDTTNKTHKDSVLNVTITVEETSSNVMKSYITKTNEGNYVVTESDGETLRYEKVSAEITYSYGTVEKEFTYEKISDMYMKGGSKIDFMGIDPKDAKISTKVLSTPNLDAVQILEKITIKCDGKTYKNEADGGSAIAGVEIATFENCTINTADISVPTYKFYGDVLDPYAIFNESMVNDESLRSNDAMKTYVKDHGSIGEDFSAAKSTAESPMPSSGGPNILLFVAIGIGAVVIIAVVAFIFLKKK